VSQDNELWRTISYDRAFATRAHLRLSRGVHAPQSIQSQAAAALSVADGESRLSNEDDVVPPSTPLGERTRAMANWDPSYPEEKIDWYTEYVSRYGPVSMSYTEPVIADGQNRLESRGLGLYASQGHKKALAPMDDGTLCLWDISNERGKNGTSSRGAVIARSKPGLLSTKSISADVSSPRASMASPSVVECVRVDSFHDKAYVAVHDTLLEVDLNTLQVSAMEDYPFSISALSPGDDNLPTTVGTTLSLHLHDPRQPNNHRSKQNEITRIETVATFPTDPRQDGFSNLPSVDRTTGFASLFQPGPLSIHHLPAHGLQNSSEIFVAGRFPSILVYDRRTFPRLRTNFHSGSRLSSLTSLPFSFRSLDSDLLRKQQLSLREVEETKSVPGSRLIACGEYNGKGSLEIYGMSSHSVSEDFPPSQKAGLGQTSNLKNRVSASRSKLLSVTPHGTRLLVSDSDGNLRWFERDGVTLVRAWNVNAFDVEGSRGVFGVTYAPSGGEVARKLIPIAQPNSGASVGEDEILVWTGERIGVLGFVEKPRFGGFDGKEWHAETLEDRLRHREERVYGETMRRALQRQADEVRMMQGLGLLRP
jgi:hypothetical protein